jgi:hypothetical protein
MNPDAIPGLPVVVENELAAVGVEIDGADDSVDKWDFAHGVHASSIGGDRHLAEPSADGETDDPAPRVIPADPSVIRPVQDAISVADNRGERAGE